MVPRVPSLAGIGSSNRSTCGREHRPAPLRARARAHLQTAEVEDTSLGVRRPETEASGSPLEICVVMRKETQFWVFLGW